MEERAIEVKFLRQGMANPIWGLFLDENTVIGQYPSKEANEALEFFVKEQGQELKEKGFTHIKYENNKKEI